MFQDNSSYAWCALVAVVLICSGCATTSDNIDPAFAPNEREGLVYGRMEFVVNGQTLPQDARAGLIKPKVVAHVSKFGGISELNSNAWKAGEFMFDAPVSDSGEFAAKLPVGRYYFVEFMYFGAGTGPAGMAGWRTYTEIMHGDVFKPMVVTFDVLPGKATYLGTIRHLVQLGSPKLSGQAFFFNLEFVDEYGNSTEALMHRFPRLTSVTAPQMYRIETLSAPLK